MDIHPLDCKLAVCKTDFTGQGFLLASYGRQLGWYDLLFSHGYLDNNWAQTNREMVIALADRVENTNLCCIRCCGTCLGQTDNSHIMRYQFDGQRMQRSSSILRRDDIILKREKVINILEFVEDKMLVCAVNKWSER